MLESFTFAKYVGTWLSLLWLVLGGWFVVGSLWSL